jgi:hypothetical protein
MWGLHSYRLISTSRRVPAEIVALTTSRDLHGRPLFAPTFQFNDADGRMHTVQSNSGSNPPSYHVGDSAVAVYIIGREDDAMLVDWPTLWGGPATLVTLGMAFLLAGSAMYAFPQRLAALVKSSSGPLDIPTAPPSTTPAGDDAGS